ncbi:MAG TPA: nucleotide sugar dehydrogenase [Conexivisphaerales archaeon]|nr:nucleotide sugar dehydrogenase [Conexivisphaerales archaeon]
MDILRDLKDEPAWIREGKLHVAVFGAGRVGTTVAAAWLRAGARVILADIDRGRVGTIARGDPLYPDEPHIDETFRNGFKERRFIVTAHPSQAAAMADVNIVAVPVGLKGRKADLSSVKSVFRDIASRMRKGTLSVLETSVPPGTCREVVVPILEGSGMKVESDFGLAYSPERIFEGRSLADLEENYPKVVSGFGPRSLAAVSTLYSCVAKKGVLQMSCLEAAETEKLFEGVYRDVNIALANELAMLCEKLGIDFWEVQKASNSQPYSRLHRPGLGVGGACIPVYPVFVAEAAKENKAEAALVKEARSINLSMPDEVAGRALYLLEGKERKVAVLGLAFRADVADDRLSPTYDLLKALKRSKCSVKVHDPFVRREEAAGFPVVADVDAALAGCNLVIVATDHRAYRDLDYSRIQKASGGEPMVFDARGCVDRARFPPGKLFVLGTGQ